MRAVAERFIVRRLTTANVESAGLLYEEAQRLDPGARVGPIAKRLLLRPPATAIQVGFPLGKLDLIGALLGDHRVVRHAQLRLAGRGRCRAEAVHGYRLRRI